MSLALGHAAVMAACAWAGGGGTTGSTGPLPRSSLAVQVAGSWRVWWRSDQDPIRHRVPALAPLVRWRAGSDGVAWGELRLAGSGEAWRTRIIVARVDPRRVRLTLDTAFERGNAAWSIDRARAGSALAVNAGQFLRSMPWGWVVLDGALFLKPSVAPLVSTFSVSPRGDVRLTHATVPDSAGVQWAFQSYPTLLNAGVVPEPLRVSGCGVDVAHRDARLALGLDAGGRLLIAMTRFDAIGGALDRVPFGLTTPEMGAVIGALGATDAVLLDGGVSAQLMLRDAAGTAHRWPGVRKVPLALLASPLPPAAKTP